MPPDDAVTVWIGQLLAGDAVAVHPIWEKYFRRLVGLARKRLRIYEVPVAYHGRTYQEGKKIRMRDGFWAIWIILKYGLLKRGLN